MKKGKTLFIIAGANGSGKTTFALNFSVLKVYLSISILKVARRISLE